uniref:Uncharacterized protein n=1 Tax=viral metagenome TaxID=1070528 RepID=A0A6H1ZUN4_9ZZZZ
MIENYLTTYGPLGLWTAWLLYEKQKLLSKFSVALEENTKLLRQMINKLK